MGTDSKGMNIKNCMIKFLIRGSLSYTTIRLACLNRYVKLFMNFLTTDYTDGRGSKRNEYYTGAMSNVRPWFAFVNAGRNSTISCKPLYLLYRVHGEISRHKTPGTTEQFV